MRPDPKPPRIPRDSLIFGYGPTLPLVAAAIGVWITAFPSAGFVTTLSTIWGAVILVFVAGVRRGYGFGNRAASTVTEITAMIVYSFPAPLPWGCPPWESLAPPWRYSSLRLALSRSSTDARRRLATRPPISPAFAGHR